MSDAFEKTYRAIMDGTFNAPYRITDEGFVIPLVGETEVRRSRLRAIDGGKRVDAEFVRRARAWKQKP